MSDAIATTELDRLLNLLDDATAKAEAEHSATAPEPSPTSPVLETPALPLRDAIDVVLHEAPRTTAVQSLRRSPVVQAFRLELMDGMIRADSVNRLLRLVNEVVVRLLA